MNGSLARLEMQVECAALVHRLYLRLDEHEAGDWCELFAPEAVFMRLGKRTVGVQAIGALLGARPRDLATRHVITNAVVDATAAGHARGVFYMTVVRRHGVEASEPRPLRVAGPWRLSKVSVDFVQTTEGWRIGTQETETQFEFATEAG